MNNEQRINSNDIIANYVIVVIYVHKLFQSLLLLKTNRQFKDNKGNFVPDTIIKTGLLKKDSSVISFLF